MYLAIAHLRRWYALPTGFPAWSDRTYLQSVVVDAHFHHQVRFLVAARGLTTYLGA